MAAPKLTFSISGERSPLCLALIISLWRFSQIFPIRRLSAAATKAGEEYGVGKGALIASFSTTPANTQRSFEVYDDYLVHGDGNYRISLFAQGEDGSWNDNYYYIPVGSTAYITADGEPYLCMRE